MKKRHTAVSTPLALLTILLLTTGSPTFAANSFSEAFSEGEFGYSLRWRLENVDQDVATLSSTTWGLRFSGNTGNDGPKLGYVFEYASQKENADNPIDFGTEFDGFIKRKFKDNFNILFRAASFSADSPAYTDTTKFWVQFGADF